MQKTRRKSSLKKGTSPIKLKKPKKTKVNTGLMAFISTPNSPIINANKIRSGKEYQGESETKCDTCKVEFYLDDMVVNCAIEHTFHRNCIEGKVENVRECPLCQYSMLFEDDCEVGSLRSLSPKRRASSPTKKKVAFSSEVKTGKNLGDSTDPSFDKKYKSIE